MTTTMIAPPLRSAKLASRAAGAARVAALLLVSASAAGTSACVVTAGQSRQGLVSSSLDANEGQPHRVVIDESGLNAVVDRLIALGRERELTLVKQSECKTQCDLAFRGKPVDRRIFRGTSSLTLSYYSRYFVSARRQGGRIALSAVGVPVLGGEMSCPPYLEQRQGCTAPKLTHQRGSTLTESVRAEWGYDVSGAAESETLQGWLAELRRGSGPAAGRATGQPAGARAGRRATMIVAVFDIEDQSGSVSAATLRQLTEYLAAKVTQLARYQVVPRDQLRIRLSQEKRRSYRKCYEQQCQIELGKAVAAQKSLATKLLRVGKQCALTSMLYDLKSETTDLAASARTACSEEALLGGVERLAQQLSQGEAQ